MSKTDRNGSITIYTVCTWKNWVRTTPQKVRKFPAKVRKYPQKYANWDFLSVGMLRIFLKPSKTVLLQFDLTKRLSSLCFCIIVLVKHKFIDPMT